MEGLSEQSHQSLALVLLALQFQYGSGARIRREIKELASNFDCREQRIRELFAGVNRKSWTSAQRELERAEQSSVHVISLFDPQYPRLLRCIDDPPTVLFLRGNLGILGRSEPRATVIRSRVQSGEAAQLILGVVGTRRASHYGLRTATRFGEELTKRGIVVVSGLALGVDAAAHKAAVAVARELAQSSSSVTMHDGVSIHPGIAVLGSGVMNIFPRENLYLAEELLERGGLIVSEYGVQANPRTHFYPERNRIISGLSHGVLVVEAAKRSGALITARLALEQGRELFLVPGQIDAPNSEGTNCFLRQGAGALVRDVGDIYEAFGISEPSKSRSVPKSEATSIKHPQIKRLGGETNEDETVRTLTKTIGERVRVSFDELCEIFSDKLEVGELTSLLMELEIEGVVRALPGQVYVLSDLETVRPQM